MDGGGAPVAIQQQVPVVVTENGLAPDTFSLLADYRDPFSAMPARRALTARKKPQRRVVKKETEKAKKVEETPVDWSFVAYRGLFKNKERVQKTGLVTVGDSDYVVSEGDSAAQVSIKELYRDSVGVYYKGNFSYIKKR